MPVWETTFFSFREIFYFFGCFVGKNSTKRVKLNEKCQKYQKNNTDIKSHQNEYKSIIKTPKIFVSELNFLGRNLKLLMMGPKGYL
jgi:hypothetical protein